MATSAEVEFTFRFDSKFVLVVSLATRIISMIVWLINNGVSCHMTGVREHFMSLIEGVDLEMVLGDDTRVKVVGVRIVSFPRESLPRLRVMEVLYILGLRRNLISVSCIEDMGYVVVFRNGQVLMYLVGSSMSFTRAIGVRDDRLFSFMF